MFPPKRGVKPVIRLGRDEPADSRESNLKFMCVLVCVYVQLFLQSCNEQNMSGIRGLRGLYFRFLPASIRSLASAAQQPMAVNSYLDQWVKIWDVCVEIGACLKVWHILIIIYWSSNIHFSILTSMGSSYMNKHLKKWILLVSMHHHSFNLKPKAFKRFAGLFPWAILARDLDWKGYREKIIAMAQPAHLPLKKRWSNCLLFHTGEVEVKPTKVI